MLNELSQAFDAYNKKGKSESAIFFEPEIKVKRSTDTLYISKLVKRNSTLIATVEVHDGKTTDKAPMPITVLNDVAQRAILIRLKM